MAGSHDLPLTSATLSQERLQLQSPARAVCAVYSIQPLRNYFGLLFLTGAGMPTKLPTHSHRQALIKVYFQYTITLL